MPASHISLYVADIDRTVDFYDQFFDQPAAKRKPGYAKYELTDPNLVLSFVQNPENLAPRTGHFGIRVDTQDTLSALHRRAAARDLIAFTEEKVSCCYAVQDKFWVRDPDGYRWEVYYFHEDSEFNDPEYALKEPTRNSCC